MDYKKELIAFLRFITIYNHEAQIATGNYPMSYKMILDNANRLLDKIKKEYEKQETT